MNFAKTKQTMVYYIAKHDIPHNFLRTVKEVIVININVQQGKLWKVCVMA